MTEMKSTLILVFLCFLASSKGFFHQPPEYKNLDPPDDDRQVGSPLYLTPMIDAGDIANAQNMARVVDPLDGIEPGQQPESYSGFITVNETTGSHMFFWFFPCNESAISRDAAPVSIWLNGGPGASSLFGLLELHGPLRAVFNGTGNDTIAELNPWSWYNRASIIYIDNPVGTGYSHTLPEGFVTTQEEVGVDLYEFLTQFFTLFPEYADNDFYAFGESYAGKYIPVISKKIHDENQNNPDVRIQLKGIGIGNGFISPYDQAIYSTYLHELSFLDELMLEEGLRREQLLRDAIDDGNYTLAWAESVSGINLLFDEMGQHWGFNFLYVWEPEELKNYEDFLNKPSTRLALHVGDRPYANQTNWVYEQLIDDNMRSYRDVLQFLMENYRVLVYNGNLDIACHHTAVVETINAMKTWTAYDEFQQSTQTIFTDYSGNTKGYLRTADTFRLLALRNAGHYVPADQPEAAYRMFEMFLDNTL